MTAETWWIEEPRLLGSSNPTNRDLRRLRRAGFSLLVCLLQVPEESTDYDVAHAGGLGFGWHAIPVRDFHAPTLVQLRKFTNLIERLAADTKVIVHCEAGIGRTGTFAAAHWVARGMDATSAIAHVRALNPDAIVTRGQEGAVRRFGERWHRTMRRTRGGAESPLALSEKSSVPDPTRRR